MRITLNSIYKNKIFLCLVAITIIINSGNAIITINPYLKYSSTIFSYIFLIPIFVYYKKQKINIFSSSLLMLLFMVLATCITSGFSNITYYITLSSYIIFAFGFVIVYDFKITIKYFLKFMTVISIISILGYFLSNNTNLLNILPLKMNINNVAYRVGYIFNYITIIPQRNCGIFWEPGLFATFLIMALVFEISFKTSDISVFRIILFIICIVTTKSSAGYGLLLFILFLVLFNKDKNKVNSKLYYVIVFILFFISITIVLNYSLIIENTNLAENELFKKLIFDNVQESTRYLAINHNINSFIKNPITGIGITESVKNIKYVADTSTSTYLMSIFGILGLQYTIYWIYGIIKGNKKIFFAKLVILTIFLFILNKEPHQENLFAWCLMFYFLKLSVELKNSNKK